MASFYKEGMKIQFDGYRGDIIKITETYRKNVLVVKVKEHPKHIRNKESITTIGLFEYPDGKLEFMTIID